MSLSESKNNESVLAISIKKIGDIEENRISMFIAGITKMSHPDAADAILNYFKTKELNHEEYEIELNGSNAAIVKHRDLETIDNLSTYVHLIVPGVGIYSKLASSLNKYNKERKIEVRDINLQRQLQANQFKCLCDLYKECMCEEFKEKDICKCGVYKASYI